MELATPWLKMGEKSLCAVMEAGGLCGRNIPLKTLRYPFWIAYAARDLSDLKSDDGFEQVDKLAKGTLRALCLASIVLHLAGETKIRASIMRVLPYFALFFAVRSITDPETKGVQLASDLTDVGSIFCALWGFERLSAAVGLVSAVTAVYANFLTTQSEKPSL